MDEIRERKYRIWDRKEKKMIQPDKWMETFRDKDSDPSNEYDFKTREFFLNGKGEVIEYTTDHGFCLHVLQDGVRFIPLDWDGQLDK